ncbi:hypothetical protein L6E12_17225 [Actinokineospora sp. PR83]|uniref:hypothetical protein n=1 Tax=Actinokineospora sp. PR83 TaxID=2884908 RepID=UPI001F413A2D|nr:hypothetical protein [Actinokineospora sp. PR83]MCG8917528.1 hypothetical protein [Actinokineospora sp. PR83]
MDVVVQWVRTWWTKESRSGAAAARRNALPTAFVLPEVVAPVVHAVEMREWEDDFAPRSSVVRALPERDAVRLREADGTLRVMLGSTAGSLPRRRPPAVRLRPGEWVCWQMTHRTASALGRGRWYYGLTTMRLAYAPVVSPTVFLGVPTRHVDERVQLTVYRRSAPR